MEKRVKVYDDEEGIYRFEEADTDEVRYSRTINDGIFSTDQQQTKDQFDMVALERLGGMTGKGALTASQLGLKQSMQNSPS